MAVIFALRRLRVRDREHLDAFVFATARNLANNRLRTDGRSPRFSPIDDQLPGPDPFDEQIVKERTKSLRRALSDLDPVDRTILVGFACGRSSSDLSNELGLSAAGVRQRKHRAIKRLKERLSKVDRGSARG